MKTDQFIKPERIAEGKYEVSFHSVQKRWTRWNRQDLILHFSLKNSPKVLLPAYFQVEWKDDRSFKAGAKSNYYRSYQACFGLAGKYNFSVDDFKGKEVMAKVVNVTKDSDKDDLHLLNQYSKIKKMWVDKDTDKDQIPF